MRGQHSHFAFDAGKHDAVYLIGEDAGFGGDDFEFEGHGETVLGSGFLVPGFGSAV
jgi:hypothetical protein